MKIFQQFKNFSLKILSPKSSVSEEDVHLIMLAMMKVAGEEHGIDSKLFMQMYGLVSAYEKFPDKDNWLSIEHVSHFHECLNIKPSVVKEADLKIASSIIRKMTDEYDLTPDYDTFELGGKYFHELREQLKGKISNTNKLNTLLALTLSGDEGLKALKGRGYYYGKEEPLSNSDIITIRIEKILKRASKKYKINSLEFLYSFTWFVFAEQSKVPVTKIDVTNINLFAKCSKTKPMVINDKDYTQLSKATTDIILRDNVPPNYITFGPYGTHIDELRKQLTTDLDDPRKINSILAMSSTGINNLKILKEDGYYKGSLDLVTGTELFN